MASQNQDMLQIAARGLGGLINDVVFVGGAVAELYSNDPGASDIRITLDVDCVIDISLKRDYYELEALLRSKGFELDTSEGAPICRWHFKNIKMDIMPTNEDILGFSNQWYTVGFEKKISYTFPDGDSIYIFPPEIYLATKLEAHKNRGGKDLRQSHDFEDIIYFLDNRSEVLNDIAKTDSTLKDYLKSEFRRFLQDIDLTEGIESALPFGSGKERVQYILDLMQTVSTLV